MQCSTKCGSTTYETESHLDLGSGQIQGPKLIGFLCELIRSQRVERGLLFPPTIGFQTLPIPRIVPGNFLYIINAEVSVYSCYLKAKREEKTIGSGGGLFQIREQLRGKETTELTFWKGQHDIDVELKKHNTSDQLKSWIFFFYTVIVLTLQIWHFWMCTLILDVCVICLNWSPRRQEQAILCVKTASPLSLPPRLQFTLVSSWKCENGP